MSNLYRYETKRISIQVYEDYFDVQTRGIIKKFRVDKRVYYKDIEAMDFDYSEVNGVPFEGCHFDIAGEGRFELVFGLSKKDRDELKRAFLMIKRFRTEVLMCEWEN